MSHFESRGAVLDTPSLLITDDDDDFRKTLRDVFEPRGFRTLLAADGEEAVEIVQTQRVHLLLLDMYMPKLTGLDTIRRVKSLHELLPCILLSADMDERLAEEARRAKAFSVLSKPVRFAEVTSIVSRAMRSVYGWPSES
ncbi:MAG: response regulator [Planctomycetes bacterium]|nr:response regulator [Planctomycetota bacterium]